MASIVDKGAWTGPAVAIAVIGAIFSIGAAHMQLMWVRSDVDALRTQVESHGREGAHSATDRRLGLLEQRDVIDREAAVGLKEEIKSMRRDIDALKRNSDAVCIATKAQCRDGGSR